MELVGAIITALLTVLFVWWLWKKERSRPTRQKEGKSIPLLPERLRLLGGHMPWFREQVKNSGGLRVGPFLNGFMKHRLPVFALQFGSSIDLFSKREVMVCDSAIAEEIIKSKDFGLNKRFKRNLQHLIGRPSVISLDGVEWKRHRRLMQPVFRRQQLQSALEVISRHTNTRLDILSSNYNQSKDGLSAEGSCLRKPVDIVKILPDLGMDIIAEVGYGYNIYDQPPEKQKAIRKALPAMLAHFSEYVFQPSIFVYNILNRRKHKEFLSLREFIKRELIDQMLKKRRSAKCADDELPLDILSLLVDAKDEESPGGGGFSEEEVVGEAMTMFVAGYETITASLSWILYFLAKFPDVQSRVYEEVSHVESSEELATLESVGQFVYLSQVIKEVQRLSPAILSFGRGALRDTTVQGYHFPAGTSANIITYAIHHSPEEWDEPEEFKPERWEKADGGCKKSSGFTFLPFGAGARRCLGQPLAVPQMKLITAMFIRRFRLTLAAECKPVNPLTYQAGPVMVDLELR